MSGGYTPLVTSLLGHICFPLALFFAHYNIRVRRSGQVLGWYHLTSPMAKEALPNCRKWSERGKKLSSINMGLTFQKVRSTFRAHVLAPDGSPSHWAAALDSAPVSRLRGCPERRPTLSFGLSLRTHPDDPSWL